MIYTHPLGYAITSELTEILVQSGRLETHVPGGASSISRAHIHENVMAADIRPHLIVVQNTALTPPIKRETRLIQGMSHKCT